VHLFHVLLKFQYVLLPLFLIQRPIGGCFLFRQLEIGLHETKLHLQILDRSLDLLKRHLQSIHFLQDVFGQQVGPVELVASAVMGNARLTIHMQKLLLLSTQLRVVFKVVCVPVQTIRGMFSNIRRCLIVLHCIHGGKEVPSACWHDNETCRHWNHKRQ
jgi:hypothetical protein